MKIHIAIGQYEFVEVDVTDSVAAREAYNDIKTAFTDGDGVTDKELNMVLDHMLRGETVRGGVEIWARMNETQKQIINTLKKACKRINGKIKE